MISTLNSAPVSVLRIKTVTVDQENECVFIPMNIGHASLSQEYKWQQ
jgi:hypothetical protein